jgi:hypothetical protein
MRIRVFASGPLNFKAAMPSESKVICALSLHNKSLLVRPIGQLGIKELMPYFMTPKIASSGH